VNEKENNRIITKNISVSNIKYVDKNGKSKKRSLKAAIKKKDSSFIDYLEWIITLIIMNFCYYMSNITTSYMMYLFYVFMGNLIVGRTLYVRNMRLPDAYAHLEGVMDDGSLTAGKYKSHHTYIIIVRGGDLFYCCNSIQTNINIIIIIIIGNLNKEESLRNMQIREKSVRNLDDELDGKCLYIYLKLEIFLYIF
jgi:hypothetical protein